MCTLIYIIDFIYLKEKKTRKKLDLYGVKQKTLDQIRQEQNKYQIGTDISSKYQLYYATRLNINRQEKMILETIMQIELEKIRQHQERLDDIRRDQIILDKIR